MADKVTSIYDLERKFDTAKKALADAKKNKASKDTIASLNKSVKNAEAVLKAAKRAIAASKKGK